MGKKRKVTVKWYCRRSNRAARKKERVLLRKLGADQLDEKPAPRHRHQQRWDFY